MEHKKFKVSICVVTFNQNRYIKQCLQSIVDQEVDFPYELIVSDDKSTDGTAEIILDFANRYPEIIKPIFHEKNIGAFENFLFVHNRAIGEYVAHMDGDDYWLPGKLKYQVQLLDDNLAISQCWTCAELVDDNGNYRGVFPSKLARLLNPKIISPKDIALSYALVGHHSTQLYRRSARQQELLENKCLDYWIAFVNSLSGNCFYSKEILSVYRISASESITRNSNTKKATVDVLAQHLFCISEKYPCYAEEAKANILVRRAISSIRGHDLKIIDDCIFKMQSIPAKKVLIIKSFYYFIVQKLGY